MTINVSFRLQVANLAQPERVTQIVVENGVKDGRLHVWLQSAKRRPVVVCAAVITAEHIERAVALAVESNLPSPAKHVGNARLKEVVSALQTINCVSSVGHERDKYV